MSLEKLNKTIYIDANNLHRAAKELGFQINYKKFYGWLKQKFNVNIIYIFIGFVEDNKKLYEYLESCGFILIFKETFPNNEQVKGIVIQK